MFINCQMPLPSTTLPYTTPTPPLHHPYTSSPLLSPPISVLSIDQYPRYKCPRYERSGTFDEKSEVFSFGIVLLEIITGDLQVGSECMSVSPASRVCPTHTIAS